jgi:GTP cyclohydrolase II
MPRNQGQSSIRHTERAVAELRRGERVLLRGRARGLLVWAAETVDPGILPAKEVTLLLTANRAKALWPQWKEAVMVPLTRKTLKALPSLMGLAPDFSAPLPPPEALNDALAQAALELVKLSELLPAAIVAEVKKAPADAVVLEKSDLAAYEKDQAGALKAVVEAPLTLKEAKDARIVGFRAPLSGKEHYAIVVGSPKKSEAPLVRIHSSCYTGDLLASLKCDCRDQLQEALHFMAENGGGVLLYLMQEGRGIGLINKLRAYHLQSRGKDTVEANEILGFADDERPFYAASQMLKSLGFSKVRLLTNNPRKVEGLEGCGIRVTERVDHVMTPHEHNERYLKTKFSRLGHVRK